ncbi:MAG: UDP-2,3-diacylglucosamine diphosphatase LpxI [Rhodospirillales bacterium]|jgi:hypothetical protein|nr:UDP-2,3-diacylglucosamine pyrophosphatase [Rhodospirillaceae bacterium]MDP6430628.1 UDP-2,3-diacylglucosamine diphosphatase LpxI [Rhodospirillales bacterium]MDP6645643.1 UDP-2,3-diacylglucosamine diphosphatase LpxI [Rhodospirillales bacterium]|tara:strand:- start:3589 stop:4428 length:840 start_codon:yes stop_codon:yes gene_type:complete
MPPKLGILAGGGELPKRLIELCRSTGREYFVIAFQEQADAELTLGTPHAWLRIGAGAKILETLKREKVAELVMAGRIKRPPLAQLKPDAYTARFIAKIGRRMIGDNNLLSAIAEEFENEGFRIIGADELIQDIVAPAGVLGAIAPSQSDLRDIDRGIEAARQLGERDAGQAVIVLGETVIERETEDGTDAMIERFAGQFGGQPDMQGGVLVKMKKPRQDRRVDLPTIGAKTIELAASAGLRGVAIEAGNALVLDLPGTIGKADEVGIFVVGVAANDQRE